MKKVIRFILLLALLCLFSLYSFSKIIVIGERLRGVHVSLEYIFYVLAVLILLLFIIKPVLQVFLAPYYSLKNYVDEDVAHDHFVKTRALSLLKEDILNEEEKNSLKEIIAKKDKELLSRHLIVVYNSIIKNKINEIIKTSSRETMLLTAVSQSSFIDSLIVLTNNVRMVKKIVVTCGFRPTFIRLTKLYTNVLASSFLADGLQKLDVTNIINSTIQGSGKILTNSAINGITNAFFMLRVGVLTRDYLYAQDPKKDRVSLKNNAFIEAGRLLPSMIIELVGGSLSTLVSVPINAAKKFTNKQKEKNEEEKQYKVKFKLGKEKVTNE